jgi:DNA-dependent RNA polymerase auxiliary subunit epsilon
MEKTEEKSLIGEELKAAQKKEAISRMKLLKMHENAIRDFESEGKLNQSECGGILYWMDEKGKAIVKAFEQEYGGVVYHAIKSITEIGDMLTLLYVSANTEEWEQDRNDLKEDGYAIAFVENLTDPDLSELGGVVVKPRFGGVSRLY